MPYELGKQGSLAGFSPSPADEWAEDSARHVLDELFNATQRYKSSATFRQLLDFVSRFRFYSFFNSFLIHLQRPGALYVAPPIRWKKEYQRVIKSNATPIVILRPNGPVMFVFDVRDTEPLPGADPLPREVTDPFGPRAGEGKIRRELDRTIENAKRDGIRILPHHAGTQSAGSIRWASAPNLPYLQFCTSKDGQGRPKYQEVKPTFELLVNNALSPEAAYVAIVHELAHLYCGHIGTPNRTWWPDRQGLHNNVSEFEAESAAYLVCNRLGLKIPSDSYLYKYLEANDQIPEISLECVVKSAGSIEAMGQKRLSPRKGS